MLINSPNISGSLTVTGNSVITGSLTVLGSITGAITGSATSASYVEYSNVANKPTLVSGSSQVTYSGLTGIPSGIVSGSAQVTYSGLTGIPSGIVSGSSQVVYSGLTGVPSGIVSGSSQVVYSGLTGVPSGIVSGSSQVTYSGLTGVPSGIVSGSAQIASFGIFATTGSNGFNGSQSITGSLTVTGQVVAQTLNVQQVTSSIVYSCGSNVFGTSLANTQQFTGSMFITGSNLNANVGSACFQGSVCAPAAIFSGCVGIGTISPQANLQVLGTIKVATGNAQGILGLGEANGTTVNVGLWRGAANAPTTDGNFLNLGGYDGIVFATGNAAIGSQTERVRLDTSGNLLVGSLSAGNAGTINVSVGCAGTTSGGIQLWAATNQTHYLQFGDGTAGASPYVGYVGYAHSTDSLLFGTATDTRAIISSTGVACFSNTVCAPVAIFSGCVGIGTPSPCYKLDVRNANGTGAQTIVSVVNKTNDSNTGAFIGFGDAYTDTVSPYLFAARVGGTREGAGDGGYMSFYTRPTSGFEYERMRITAGGIACFACQVCAPTMIVNNCINIGTTTSLGSRLSIESPNDQAGITMFNTFDCNKWSLRTGTTGINNKGFGIVDDICNATRIQIDGAGNVGIGTTSPCSKLHIVGEGDTVTLQKSNNVPALAFLGTSTNKSVIEGGDSFNFYTSNGSRMCIASTGITTFACGVCAPSIITNNIRLNCSTGLQKIEASRLFTANTTTYYDTTIGQAGMLIVNSSNDRAGVFVVSAPGGGNSAISEIGDPSSYYSTTCNNANTVNFFFSAGSGNLIMQNCSGTTRDFSLTHVGTP